MLQIIVFAVLAIGTFALAAPRYLKIRRNILLGQDEVTVQDSGQAWRNVLLIAFGQKKMFKRWIPAVFHFFIYVAFLFTQIELIEIFIDGFTGQHRFFAPFLGGFYTLLISTIEVLSFLALIGTLIFLVRRNLIKVPRFIKPEMKGWPTLDGNIILYLEILLITGITCMNGADQVLQGLGADHYPQTGNFAISSWLGPMLFGSFSESTLIGIERFGWWLHIIVVFGFILYLPISKHLHIFLAFPNTYFARQTAAGKMVNMPEVEKEVRSMMDPNAAFDESAPDEELPTFGASDVTQLSWKNIMDSYTCTECGRCTSVCPANQTGKKLSPRKVLMDIRDRATEIGEKLDSGKTEFIAEDKKESAEKLTADNFDDGKNLFDYITREELHACTTCNACVEACPVLINPLDPILRLRRYEILTESAGPSDWMPMFTSIENSGSVWQIPDARDKWRDEALKEAEE